MSIMIKTASVGDSDNLMAIATGCDDMKNAKSNAVKKNTESIIDEEDLIVVSFKKPKKSEVFS